MNRTIDLEKTVYEICSEYPETKDILDRLGFHDIMKPGILNTVGKLMTIPRGAAMRSLDLSKVVSELQAGGFEIKNAEFGSKDEDKDESAAENREDRTARLKEYVGRLSRGDDLEAVRKDFVAHFQSVDAAEIANAEQELILSGTPAAEVQRLCDVHSALFHGSTREEQIANAERTVQASAERTGEVAGKSANLQPAGHPINVFIAENNVISGWIAEIRELEADGAGQNIIPAKLHGFHALTVHYSEKGDLLYPLLKSKYHVSGPADVMWGVDDEIRDELKVLADVNNTLPNFTERLDRLLTRAEEMIYKENNILFPLCTQNFSETDWMHIYYELSAYDRILSDERPIWDAAEKRRGESQERCSKEMKLTTEEGRFIPLNSGHMTPVQIEAVLNTIPMELSFIDNQDLNRFFNSGKEKKLFKRPDDAVDREVFSCHPPKYAAMARQIIHYLRTGAKDSVDVWMNKHGEPVFVRYMAVRDKNGDYIGTLECVQKMGFAREYFAGSIKK